MTEKDYEYKDINTKFLDVDTYQRKLDLPRVRRIIKHFDRRLVNPIKVSFRDGKYYVFDGRHTMEALRQKNHYADLMVECKVFYGLTFLDEVDLFVKQNGDSRPVNIASKLNALYISGDEDVVSMCKLVESAGAEVSLSGTSGDGKICALAALVKLYKNLSKPDFLAVIDLLTKTWNGMAESYSAKMLNATMLFYKAYKDEYDQNVFISHLKKVSPVVIIREGDVSKVSGNTKYARQMLNIYNKGLKYKLQDRL